MTALVDTASSDILVRDDGSEEKNILYDLLVPFEWAEMTSILV